MGFRLNYFTCIAHLYLYYTLLVPHTYASYIRHWCIFSHYEIQYKSSSISNMVSEPSLWLFLGSPVFIGIILDSQLLSPLQLLLQPFAVKPLTCFSHRLWFRTCSRRHSESRDHYQIVAAVIVAPIVFLQVPLRSSSANLPSHGNLTIIGSPTHPPASPKDSAQKLMRSTHRHAPPGSITRYHVLSRASTCDGAWRNTLPRARFSPADVSPRWRYHCHVICWRHSPVSWRHRWPGRWPDRWLALTLTVDFSPELTFAVQVLLTQFFV